MTLSVERHRHTPRAVSLRLKRDVARGETRVADAEASAVAVREALDVARRESDERVLRLRAALETRHEKRVDELRALHAAQVRTLRGENRRRAAAMQAEHDDCVKTNVGLARHLEVASRRGVGRGSFAPNREWCLS